MSSQGLVKVDAGHLQRAIAKYEKQKAYIEPKMKLLINNAKIEYMELPWWHWFLRDASWTEEWEYAIRYLGNQARHNDGGGKKPLQVEEEFLVIGWMDAQEYSMLERVAWADSWQHRNIVGEFKKMLEVGNNIHISPTQAEFVTTFTK
jgi:hypothetical protein